MLDGHLQIGDILAANLYVLMLIWPLRMLGQLIGQVPRSVSACGRIHDVLVTDPRIVDAPDAQSLADGGRRAALRARDVRLRQRAARARRSRSRDPGGEAVALVGATASGKTTMARLIPRFYDVNGGRVLLDGVDVRELRLAELRRAIGIVFEDTFLFTESVRDNIAFADPGAPMDGCGARPGWPAPTGSSRVCPRATTPCSVSTASRCRVASVSASRSPARCWPIRRC